MKSLIYVCFILLVTNEATGQTTEPICSNVNDFGQCLSTWNCDGKVSTCACFEGKPYCRCNNRKGEFYIDEDCSQRWTVVTFALVASLPGVAFAVLVGVIVYVIMLSSDTKSHKRDEGKTASPKEEDLFPGITFASDVTSRPNQVPMVTMPNRNSSMSSGMRDPPMGGPVRNYSSSNSHSERITDGRPREPYSSSNSYSDRVTDGRPREPYSERYSIPSGTRAPYLGGPARPYSYIAGYGQTVNNPYAKDLPSRNAYEDRVPSPDHRNDYRQPAPSHTYEDVNPHYSPAPLNSSSEIGNSRGGFPRPRVNMQY